MSIQTIQLTPLLYDYLQKVSLREPEILKKLRVETHKLNNYVMQISPEQGQLMALLVQLLNAKKTLDIGTYTGYSALVVALALPPNGQVITCDVNEEWTTVAKRFWQESKMADKINLHLAPALTTLQMLLDNNEANTFDFAFIDADKSNYAAYYESCLALVKSGGLIAIDNVLWGGKVADLAIQDRATQSIRNLNEHIYHDNRVTMCMIPIGDGLTLARKN